MSTTRLTHAQPTTSPTTLTSATDPVSPSVGSLFAFAVAAVGLGGALLAASTRVQPGAPFVIAAVLFGLAFPALVLTHRETGRAGVRAMLRDCIRPPSRWWWLPLAGFGLPILTWTMGAALGGAQPLTGGLVVFYVGDLVLGALIINIWEEMAWTGYFQRHASRCWGVVSGSLVTSIFFVAIHLPLALDGVTSKGQAAANLLYLASAAVGVRLLIARVDPWSGRSLLTIGILHSAFNATETVLKPDYFWVRLAVTIALGVSAVALGRTPGR